MNKKVYFILWMSVFGMVGSSCGLRAYRAQAKEAAIIYSPSSGNEKDFSIAKSFCLDDDTSIIKINTAGISVTQFQLLNRWGQAVMTTKGAEFIPVKMFPVPPASMSEMGAMTWRLSWVNGSGTKNYVQGNINYLGTKCKK
ncbi:MAG: hypothetical protein ACOVOO_09160 [Flavobacteriales bacterium]